MIDLGAQPAPAIEPAEPPPGGVDAVEDPDSSTVPVVPDLTAVLTTSSADEMPEELREPEESKAGAATDGADEPEKEAPA
jgi:hypothetical protein